MMRVVWDLAGEELDRALEHYVQELHTQTYYARRSFDHFHAAFEAMRLADKATAVDIFYGLHGLVSAGGNISKLLWPSPRNTNSRRGRRALERGAVLRQLLQVSDGSPLRLRTLRDDLEHFDERIDTVLDRLSETVGLPSVIASDCIFDSFEAFDVSNGEAHYLRALCYEPAFVLRVLDHDLDLGPYIGELNRVHDFADSWLSGRPRG